ncbi:MULTISPECIES: glutamate--tRNA ligase [unclassified Isoptericola]|uniref:glutamate--tRNA ligase n=1 Tax=unclassified Isoptericola TaxID=2623355 RepID=UPI0027130960|nr:MULTISPECIES: glutamate--tRNA ligase [unclassified Isoptericola]MDO8145486.1 glutamate--tRNA ligase [Isoptericola sp. 178]MDO8149127.1 glutamate--tRNA ligase [Isoptericola sp. b515]
MIPAAGTSSVRVRFAPSPTGMFHVGGARSALFNWAVAKQTGGRFVLRIEDTDTSRNKPEWVDGILAAHAALGMHADDPTFEGPYFQSANLDKHREALQTLLAAGSAYYCDCTRDDVTARTGSQQSGYDGHCRDRGLTEAPGRALRFRTPDEGETRVVDLIRGNPVFPNGAMEDFVVARGDGSPVFLLANVVDDLDEGITHVIRGEEHLSNTPKQQLLWIALGAEPPVWAHLPVIVNEKRQKLSKRRDKVALEDYLAEGYLPAAMVNYLMLLGWAPGNDEEILPFEEMIERFRIEDVNSAAAFFDLKKLAAFNGEYIRALSVDEFIAAVGPWLRAPHAPWAEEQFDPAAFAAVAPLAQSRVALLGDITDNVDFLFLDEPVFDEKSWNKAMKPGAVELLTDVRAALATLDPWEAEPLKNTVATAGEWHGMKLGKAQAPVRVAVTGRTIGLPLFESLEVLGRERTLGRIDAALAALAENAPQDPVR